MRKEQTIPEGAETTILSDGTQKIVCPGGKIIYRGTASLSQQAEIAELEKISGRQVVKGTQRPA